MTNEEKEIAEKIGQFYLQKNGGDYEKAGEELFHLGITKLEVTPERINISLAYVGKLIGKRGETIDALEKFLGAGRRIHIVEDDLIFYLIPVKPEPSEDVYEQFDTDY